RELRAQQDRLARFPTVDVQEVRHAADGVRARAAQIDGAVTVEVDRVAAHAPRHELRNADRAGIRALQREDVEARLAREQQVLLELVAEIARARRIVEGERGERVYHPVAAHVAAVVGLDAEDRDDDRGGDTVFALGARQDLAVHLPEGGAARDARLVDELGAVVLPRGAPGGQDELQRGIETLGAREYALELGGVETMALDQLADETLHFRPLI